MTTAEWDKIAKEFLKGRKIVGVRYATDHEAESYLHHNRGVRVLLDNGSWFWVSRDDEANDAGVIHGMDPEGFQVCLPVLPVGMK